MNVKTIRYQNGFRVALCNGLSYDSATVGLFVRAGSAYENDKNNGISHFIEHMLFKGTEKRTAFQIAEDMDAIGAVINAFTGKEFTCYLPEFLLQFAWVDIPVYFTLRRRESK